MGDGQGDVFDFYTSDPMLLPYFRKLKSKIDPLWANAFPKSAMLELKQGTVILEFTVSADGQVKVTWPPTRPSGIDEFDRNCADAIRRAGPFEPIPQALRDRGYNPTDRDTTLTVSDRTGWIVDLRGAPVIPFDGTTTLRPWEITTLLLAP